MDTEHAKAAYAGLREKRKTFAGKAAYLERKGVRDPKALTAWLEHKATGKWPGERRKSSSVPDAYAEFVRSILG